MKLVPKAVEKVVDHKAEDTTAEVVETVKDEGMMVVVDAEPNTADTVRIVQVTDVVDWMKEWYSAMMEHR